MSTERELRAQRWEQTREQRPTLSRGGSVSSRSSHASLGLGFNSPIQPSTTRHRPPGHCPESLEHILVEVLDLPPDGILAQALKHAKITCFIDLMAMTDVAIDSLVYPRSQTPDDEGDFQDDQLALVPLSIRSLIKVIQGYVYYRKHVHNDPVNPDNCMDIDYGSVLDYRASGEFLTFGNRPIPPPIIQKPSRRTPAAEFDRSIRRDPSSFPTFSNDKQWKNYNRNLAAICRTYGLQNVLNHKYRPQTVDEKGLFDRQQAFMYQVFTTTLLTDKGKQFVHEHQATFDAQKIYNQLAKAYTKSVKADATATGLLRWIMTARLDDSWRNTHESFIIHWQEQVRKYHTLADISQRMPETQQHLLLEQALIAVPYLDEIQRLSRILEMQTGKAIIFDDYVTLVESAAQSYDTRQDSKTKPKNNPSRDIYFTDVRSGFGDDNLPMEFNIDTDIGEYQAYRSSFTPGRRPRLPQAQWSQLDDEARRHWQQLPDKAKAIILGASSDPARPPPPPPPPLRRLVNLHDISAAELLDHLQDASMGSASGALPPEVVDTARDSILAHVTECQSLKPGDIKRLMSDKLADVPSKPKGKQEAKQHEIVIDGKTY